MLPQYLVYFHRENLATLPGRVGRGVLATASAENLGAAENRAPYTDLVFSGQPVISSAPVGLEVPPGWIIGKRRAPLRGAASCRTRVRPGLLLRRRCLQLVAEDLLHLFHLGPYDDLAVRLSRVVLKVVLVVPFRAIKLGEGDDLRDDRPGEGASFVQLLFVVLGQPLLLVGVVEDHRTVLRA